MNWFFDLFAAKSGEHRRASRFLWNSLQRGKEYFKSLFLKRSFILKTKKQLSYQVTFLFL